MCQPDSEGVQPDTNRPRPHALKVNRIWRSTRSAVVDTPRKVLPALRRHRIWSTLVVRVAVAAVGAELPEAHLVVHQVEPPAAAVEVAVVAVAVEPRVDLLRSNSPN